MSNSAPRTAIVSAPDAVPRPGCRIAPVHVERSAVHRAGDVLDGDLIAGKTRRAVDIVEQQPRISHQQLGAFERHEAVGVRPRQRAR